MLTTVTPTTPLFRGPWSNPKTKLITRLPFDTFKTKQFFPKCPLKLYLRTLDINVYNIENCSKPWLLYQNDMCIPTAGNILLLKDSSFNKVKAGAPPLALTVTSFSKWHFTIKFYANRRQQRNGPIIHDVTSVK